MYFYVLFWQGIHLVTELINSYGLDVVQAYMEHIQQNAEVAVRNLLREVAQSRCKVPSRMANSPFIKLEAEDKMDDGSMLKLTVDIDASKVWFPVDNFSGHIIVSCGWWK